MLIILKVHILNTIKYGGEMKKLLLFLFLLFLISGCSVSTDDDSSSGSSDGTADSPAELTVGTAKSGGIATNGYSYYKFTTSSTGAGSYKLEIASMTITDGWGTYAVSTNLYSDSGYTTSSQLDWDSCAASCTLNFDYENLDASKTYYLKLSALGTITYSLTVSRGGVYCIQILVSLLLLASRTTLVQMELTSQKHFKGQVLDFQQVQVIILELTLLALRIKLLHITSQWLLRGRS